MILGARVDPAGVRNDQRSVLCFQERSPDLTRPDDEVPQPVKFLDDECEWFLRCMRGVVDELTRRLSVHMSDRYMSWHNRARKRKPNGARMQRLVL